MIPKLICFIFGHKRYWQYFTGETAEITDRLTNFPRIVPVMVEKANTICPRCGADLKGKDGK